MVYINTSTFYIEWYTIFIYTSTWYKYIIYMYNGKCIYTHIHPQIRERFHFIWASCCTCALCVLNQERSPDVLISRGTFDGQNGESGKGFSKRGLKGCIPDTLSKCGVFLGKVIFLKSTKCNSYLLIIYRFNVDEMFLSFGLLSPEPMQQAHPTVFFSKLES